MKTRDGSFCGEFALVSRKKYPVYRRSHFGPEPTSKRLPSRSEKILKDWNLQEHNTFELVIGCGQETAHFVGNLLKFLGKLKNLTSDHILVSNQRVTVRQFWRKVRLFESISVQNY